MKKFIVGVCAIMLLSSTAFAVESNLQTDDKGNITGTIDGKKVKMRTDKDGNTTGTIGSAKINSHTDYLGNTTGTIGKKPIIIPDGNSADNMIGKNLAKGVGSNRNTANTTPGSINTAILNSYMDDSGNTSGKGGHRNINKRSSEILGDGMSD